MSYPIYEPPYDSPLEDEFALNFIKYAGKMDSFEKQFAVQTICGKFIIDFVARISGEIIGFECDGKQYHDFSRDEWRDSTILGSGQATTIYRFRGSDLYSHMNDCLYILSKKEPSLFSERGLINLEYLASPEVRSYNFTKHEGYISIAFYNERKGNDPSFIAIDRRSVKIPPGHREFWQSIYSFIVSQGGGDIDILIAKYRERWSLL